MRKNPYKYQTGGSLKSQKEFFSTYLQSPKYMERLKKQGYNNPSQTIKERLARVNATKFVDVTGTGTGSEYKKENGTIYYDDNETKKYGMNKEGVKAHEMSHAAGSLNVFPNRNYNDSVGLNDNDIKAIDARNKLAGRVMDDDPSISHDSRASEFKADMDTLRFFLKKDKIYDAASQDFNEEYLKKAKEKYGKDKNINRFFKNAKSDKDLIWMMNNIAYQNQAQENPIAEIGGDIKSILGYSRNSPYQNDPFIDIFTPEGLIDMSNTPKDLIGIDNKGNKKKMKAFSKNPYKFEGDIVREIPMAQQGGLQSILSYIFDEDEDIPPNATAPSIEEIENGQEELNLRKQQEEQEQYNLAMQIATGDFESGNPYIRNRRNFEQGSESSFPAANLQSGVNPYVIQTQNELMSKYNLGNLGIWGDKSHQARKSDHNTGDAQDFKFDKPETANAAISDLMSNYQKKNVKYIIFNGRIWNPSISPEWRPYKGTNPHKSHFHVSYNR